MAGVGEGHVPDERDAEVRESIILQRLLRNGLLVMPAGHHLATHLTSGLVVLQTKSRRTAWRAQEEDSGKGVQLKAAVTNSPHLDCNLSALAI